MRDTGRRFFVAVMLLALGIAPLPALSNVAVPASKSPCHMSQSDSNAGDTTEHHQPAEQKVVESGCQHCDAPICDSFGCDPSSCPAPHAQGSVLLFSYTFENIHYTESFSISYGEHTLTLSDPPLIRPPITFHS